MEAWRLEGPLAAQTDAMRWSNSKPAVLSGLECNMHLAVWQVRLQDLCPMDMAPNGRTNVQTGAGKEKQLSATMNFPRTVFSQLSSNPTSTHIESTPLPSHGFSFRCGLLLSILAILGLQTRFWKLFNSTRKTCEDFAKVLPTRTTRRPRQSLLGNVGSGLCEGYKQFASVCSSPVLLLCRRTCPTAGCNSPMCVARCRTCPAPHGHVRASDMSGLVTCQG